MHIETAPVAIIATDNCAAKGIAFSRRRAILADMVIHASTTASVG